VNPAFCIASGLLECAGDVRAPKAYVRYLLESGRSAPNSAVASRAKGKSEQTSVQCAGRREQLVVLENSRTLRDAAAAIIG